MSECADERSLFRRSEADRLTALRSFEILDTEPECTFDDIASIAAEIVAAPIAAVSFVDEHRQWFKAIVGLDVRETALDASICAHAIRQPDLFVIPDTLKDPRFHDYPLVTGDPHVRFYAAMVLTDDQGTPLGTLCVADTEPRPKGLTKSQAKALQALGRSVTRELCLRRDKNILFKRERDLVTMADALPQMVWIAGSDGHHEFRNKRYYEFTGAVPGSIDGVGWNILIHPDDADDVWSRWCRSIQTGEPYEAEYRVRHHSGEYRWVLARAIPDYNAQGQIIRWLGTSTDIQAGKLAEQALVESEERYRALIETSAAIVWRADPDGSIVQSWGWQTFSGQSPDEYLGRGWLTAVHPEDRPGLINTWEMVVVSGRPVGSDCRVRHRSGEYRWVHAQAVPLRAADGSIREWVGTLTDIHEEKQAQEALRTSEERLRLAIRTTSLGIWDADLRTGEREWTPEARDILGISSETPATRETFLERVHPDDCARIAAKFFAAVPESELTYWDECRIIRADTGEERWVSTSGRTFLNEEGRAVRKIGTIQDITERMRAEDALRDSETRLRLALDTTSVGIWDADLVTGIVQWTPETRQILGVAADTPVSHARFLERVHPDDRRYVESKPYVEMPGKGLSYSGTYRIIRADDGQERWVAASGRTIVDEAGNVVRKIGTIQDITERKRAADALQESEARLQLALQAARMVAWELDTQTGYITRSENSLAMLGLGSGPLGDFLERVHPEDHMRREEFLKNIHVMGMDTMELRYSCPDGRTLWLGSRAQKAGPNRIVGVTFDITDRKAAEEEIWRAANHDALTGLPNRVLLQHRLERALEEARQNGTSVSLLLIDLDDFKDVNDSLGHGAGDALLKETAARLSEMMRDCDTVARLGGDEFAIVIVDPLKLGNAISLADSVIKRIRQPFVYEGRTIVTKASIGVAAFPDHDAMPAELMKDADIALYRAKAEGRNRVVTYLATMRVAAEQRLTLVKEVREALDRKEMVPFYQPKICLATGRIIGLEALARWQHPVKGILTPGIFGAAFDDPELATVLSKRLIGRVVSDIRKWVTAGLDPGRVAVNFSSLEFSHPDLADNVLHILRMAKVPTKHFEVEVTEKVLLEGRSGLVSETLDKFRKWGVQIALDDFGTGYASLTHLKQFPVDHIKVDRSFVRDLECDPDDEAIVKAVIELAKSLDLQITAEGVETKGQAHRLHEMGCHNAQGYLFAHPMPSDQVAQFLTLQVSQSGFDGLDVPQWPWCDKVEVLSTT